MTLGIDHTILAVRDLEGAMALYRRLGFQVLCGGEHPQFGTHNALVPLADGFYLELMAVKDRELAEESPVTKLVVAALERANRLALYALGSDDLEGDVAAIRARGLAIGDPIAGERLRPDGVRVAWRTAHPDDPRLPFLIEDETPREVRIPVPTEGLGRSLRVAHVRISSHDADKLCERLSKLLGIRPVEGQFSLGRGGICVVSGEEYRLDRLAFVTDDLEALAEEWGSRGIPFHRDTSAGEEVLMLAPEEAAGAHIVVLAGG